MSELDVVFWVENRIFLSNGKWYEEDSKANAYGYWRWDSKRQCIINLDDLEQWNGKFPLKYTEAYVKALEKSVVT